MTVVDRYPLTPIQEGMLAHALLEPGAGIDIVQIVCRLHEPVDAAAMRQAWAKMAERHALLRTRMVWGVGAHPEQEVLDRVFVSWNQEGWTGLDPGEQEQRFNSLLLTDRTRGFAMDEAPLWRVYLVECGSRDFRLVFSVHHVVLDGAWFEPALVEAFAFYDSIRAGGDAALPPPTPFRRYVDWLETKDLNAAEGFWRTRLAGFSEPTPLPGNPGPVRQGPGTDRYRERELFLEPAVSRALEAFAGTREVTLNTLIQGAWAILLARHAGREEVVFGVTRRGRHGPAGGDAIFGPTLNTVPMRVMVAPDLPLGAWLAALREQWKALADVELSPVGRVQGWSDVPPGTPLYETIAIFETAPLDQRIKARGGAWSTREAWAYHQTNLPLTLNAYAGPRLRLRVIYDGQRFAASAIDRLLGHLRTLLEGMPADPAMTVGRLPMLTADERKTLLTDWNDTARPYPGASTLTSLLADQAGKSPDADAVRFENTAISYAELEARANRLAGHLHRVGVTPGSMVGVCAERSIELVVALVAILKAGAAYVPMDPEYPLERLAFMLEDSAVPVLLTQERLLERIPEYAGRIICLDRDWPAIEREPASAPAVPPNPDAPAYMIYTSGSTGRPKGALNAHRGIVNRLLWMQETFALDRADTVLQKTPVSFDVSVWEFFWPLISGARLVLARPGGHRDPGYLAEVIERERVTVLHFVPSMLRAFLADIGSAECRSLRDVMCSGEALSHDLIRAFGARLPARLQNLYGPTEAAVDVTWWPCDPADPGPVVPIGRPIANTRCYILDPRGEPVPIGVAGELHLGGVQVGQGYWKRPDLTAERFVPDRFGSAPGARLYRTGDSVRWRDDGNIEFLGRLDFQVKLRGFRVELGEIEAALAEQPGVGAAVVTVRQDRPGEQRLVGYYTAASAELPSAQALRSALARHLPDHMVPGTLIRLDALPLSPNGKLDRRALPAPEADIDSSRGYVAPRTDAEAALAAIWSSVLKRDRIGVTDNFFELGGDSILAIYIAVRAREAGIEVRPRDLLAFPTVETAVANAAVTAGLRGDQGRSEGGAPLTPVQHWFFALGNPEPSYWNQTFLFVVPGDLDSGALEAALADVAEHHDALRLRFRQSGGAWSQAFEDGAAPPTLEVIEPGASPLAGGAAELETAATRYQSQLDISAGPMLRAVLFRGSAGGPGRLLLAIHHLVVDGISWRVLMADLESAYTQRLKGQAARLPAKTSSFQHWALGLARAAEAGELSGEAEYWAAVVADVPPPIPRDGAGGTANLEGSSRVLVRELDPERTTALLREAPAAYNTQVNDVLLTAITEAVHEWTGAREVFLDLEGHGREDLVADADVSRTVGWFTSVFPVRFRAGGAADRGRRLLAVKETLRAIPRHGIGYGVLRYLARQPALAAAAEPEISVNYLGQFDEVLADSRLFRFAAERTGPWHGPHNPRRYALEVNALVIGGRLRLEWTWQPSLHAEATVARLAYRTNEILGEIVSLARSPQGGGRSPSDFPLAAIGQEALDRLIGTGRTVEDLYPATPMQLLFYAESSAGRDTGFEQWQYRLRGPLDADALRRAWETVVQRHPALRTGFAGGPAGDPLQLVRRQVTLPWTELDWRHLSLADREARLAELLHNDRAQGFALDAAPLLRLTLVRLDDATHLLICSHHHLLIDRLSWPVILGEVGVCYAAFLAGTGPNLPAAPGFRSYLGWLAGRDLAQAERFWRAELEGFTTPIALMDRGVAGEHPASETRLALSEALTRRLEQAARSHRLTLNAVVQGMWALWLARHAGESDVVYGLAVSGRPDELSGIDRMVGLFINNLPVRVKLDESAEAAGWMIELQRRQGERQPFEFTPLGKIHEWSGSASHARLFESLVVFQNDSTMEDGAQRLGSSVAVEPVPVATRTNYPLTLLVGAGAALELRLIYRDEWWNAGSAAAVLGQLQQLLAGFADAPERRIADLLAVLPPTQTDTAHARRKQGGGAAHRLSATAYAAPETPTERCLARTWAELLDLDRVGRDDNLFALGAHSLLVTRFVARVREELQVELPLRALFDRPTIGDLAVAIVSLEGTPGLTDRIATLLEELASMSDEELRAEAQPLEPSPPAGHAHVRR
jgi:amino acid adenylation domain-containing protein/non-ribosomal peptide synthase protein (TIGR01720 family)